MDLKSFHNPCATINGTTAPRILGLLQSWYHSALQKSRVEDLSPEDRLGVLHACNCELVINVQGDQLSISSLNRCSISFLEKRTGNQVFRVQEAKLKSSK